MHGPTSQYFVFDFSYTDRVRYNSARISLFLKFAIFRKFVFIFVSDFTSSVFVFVFKCRSRKRSRGFPTVSILGAGAATAQVQRGWLNIFITSSSQASTVACWFLVFCHLGFYELTSKLEKYRTRNLNYVTKLVMNYRCHPTVLELLSELFFSMRPNWLIACKEGQSMIVLAFPTGHSVIFLFKDAKRGKAPIHHGSTGLKLVEWYLPSATWQGLGKFMNLI